MDLHDQVDDLFPGDSAGVITYRRALIHAMVDLGQITSFECAWEHCVLPGVPFTPVATGSKNSSSVSIDHIVARVDGGTDTWSNLQLVHFTCNMRKSHAFSEETRAKMSASLRKRWEDPEYRARVGTAIAASATEDVRARRSASMKANWAARKAAVECG